MIKSGGTAKRAKKISKYIWCTQLTKPRMKERCVSPANLEATMSWGSIQGNKAAISSAALAGGALHSGNKKRALN